MKDKFEFFYGGPFSQWHPCEIEIDGVSYNTAEQYMMAMKATYFEDINTLKKIMKTSNPSEQKALGRQVANFDAEAWDAVSRGFVYKANLQKFSKASLKALLLNTGDKEIVEASPYDKIWGIGLSEDDPRCLDKSKWRGTNWLGEVLMRVREDIKNPKKVTEKNDHLMKWYVQKIKDIYSEYFLEMAYKRVKGIEIPYALFNDEDLFDRDICELLNKFKKRM